MVLPVSALLPALNTMRNTIDDADYIINESYFIFIFQWFTNFRHSHSIINEESNPLKVKGL
jgi:hypothetical protein